MHSLRTNDNRQLALELGTPEAVAEPHVPAVGRQHVVAGLFAGVGGIERGLLRSGHCGNLLCENDPVAATVLKVRFPDTTLHDDVRSLGCLPRATTLIAAGFPCQDLSQAGKTAGITGMRSGLVAEVFRLLRSEETPWVFLENVPFMLQLGGGRAMNVLATSLEQLGYRWAYRVVDSRTFGVPQRRRRVYLVATTEGDPRTVLFADECGSHPELPADPGSVARGFYWTEGLRGLGWAVDAVPTLKGGSTIGIPSSPAILLPDGSIVMPEIRDAERLQGFPAGWTKPAEQVARSGSRWKLVGNAVTVLASEWIGRRLARPGPVKCPEGDALLDGQPWPTAAWNVGGGRHSVAASEWPVRRAYRSLVPFLRFPTRLLSAKATAGFLSRAERSSLRFAPGFLQAVRTHLKRVSIGG